MDPRGLKVVASCRPVRSALRRRISGATAKVPSVRDKRAGAEPRINAQFAAFRARVQAGGLHVLPQPRNYYAIGMRPISSATVRRITGSFLVVCLAALVCQLDAVDATGFAATADPAAGSSTAQSAPAGASGSAATAKPASDDPRRWEAAIRAFEEWDRKNPFPPNALLFVGSSSIVGWPTASSFGAGPVINRGFGGSHLSDVTHYSDAVVARYSPRVVVLYAGDNDIAAGKSAERVEQDFRAFVAAVRRELPQTPIVYLSIKPSTARWEFWPIARDANRRIARCCEQDATLRYVDVASPLLAADGRPRDELFNDDRLHLNERGYAVWTERLRPVVAELMRR